MSLLQSFRWAAQGLATVWHGQRNFRIEVAAAVLATMAGWWLNVSYVDWALLAVACVLVLSGEVVNTALELLCNKVEPRHDPLIGKVKDAAAGYVLLTAAGSVAIGAAVFGHRLLAGG